MPFFERVQSGLVSVAAWIQNSFFEPEKYTGKYVQYSHTRRIIKTDHCPEMRPGMAVWQLVSDNDRSYTRIPNDTVDYEAQQLELPLIQVVVQIPRFRKRRGRTVNDGTNQANYDITTEVGKFHGDPMLDWLHLGLCVAHRYGVYISPGEYSLSIIDGRCRLHTLGPAEAAVFSIRGKRQESAKLEQCTTLIGRCSDPLAKDVKEEDTAWSEPEPEFSDVDSVLFDDSRNAQEVDDSEPEPDFED